MANHNPEDSAGAQLAILVSLQLVLSQYRGNQELLSALESELEHMRGLLLSSSASDRKLLAFDATAEALISSMT
jgi:hypothetical protein